MTHGVAQLAEVFIWIIHCFNLYSAKISIYVGAFQNCGTIGTN